MVKFIYSKVENSHEASAISSVGMASERRVETSPQLLGVSQCVRGYPTAISEQERHRGGFYPSPCAIIHPQFSNLVEI